MAAVADSIGFSANYADALIVCFRFIVWIADTGYPAAGQLGIDNSNTK